MAISFGGLASGLDTTSMVKSLVALERSATDALVTRQSNLNTQKSIVSSLASAVSGLATAVRALDVASEGKPLTATSSDSRVAVAVSSGAKLGAHDLRVQTLAAAQVVQTTTFSSRTTQGIPGDGSVDITVGGTTKSVAWTSSDTLETVMGKINEADAGVTASIVDTTGTGTFSLIVVAKTTGTAAAPTFVDSGTGSLGLANPANLKIPAVDAQFTLDGISFTRATNSITDAIDGTTLTLNAVHGATDPTTHTTAAIDQKALTEKVKAVMTAYNSINAALHIQLDYNGSPKGANTLFGDSALRGLQQQLGSVMSAGYGSDTIAAIGLSRDRTGTMTLDESKLAAAVAADPDAVSKLFVDNGFATAVTKLADSYTAVGTGILSAKTQSLTDRFTALQPQIDRINRRADDLQTRLEKQFSALEAAISALQAQSGQLQAMLG